MQDPELSTYYVFAVTVLVVLVAEAVVKLRQAWSRPALTMYFTVAVWYLGDYAFNDRKGFTSRFSEDTVNTAFCQVVGFLLAFRVALWAMTNGLRSRTTCQNGPDTLEIPEQLVRPLLVSWALLMVAALVLVGGDVASILFPPLAEVVRYPWSRGAVGGATDWLSSFGEYTAMGVCGALGVTALFARDPKHRVAAAGAYLVGIMPFLFDRARNRMLAVFLPPILSYLLYGRSGVVRKAAISAGVFAFVWIWFLIIVQYRSDKIYGRGATFFSSDRLSQVELGSGSHVGLEMLTELCFVNQLMRSGRFQPEPGSRYFAEIVAWVPRAVWPNKPFIGIDYAIARGFAGGSEGHGVRATMATGMIGQGVVNFGPIFGVGAAAVLAAAWCSMLSALWAHKRRSQSQLLFLIGLGLTFNMGRDITLLVLFPFFFMLIIIKFIELFVNKKAS